MDKLIKLYLVIMTTLSEIGHFSSALSSERKSVAPIH